METHQVIATIGFVIVLALFLVFTWYLVRQPRELSLYVPVWLIKLVPKDWIKSVSLYTNDKVAAIRALTKPEVEYAIALNLAPNKTPLMRDMQHWTFESHQRQLQVMGRIWTYIEDLNQFRKLLLDGKYHAVYVEVDRRNAAEQFLQVTKVLSELPENKTPVLLKTPIKLPE